MKTIIFISVLIIIGLVKQLSAQQTSDYNSEIINNSGKLKLSFFTGISFLGPKDDIESVMSSSGLGDTSPAGWFGGAKTHPNTINFPVFDVEASYYLAQKSGISLNFGSINNIEVKGYDGIGLGNYIFIKSELWSFSLNYLYRSKNEKHSLYLGPSYFIHNVKDFGSSITKTPDRRNKKFGVYIGYSLQILQKKHFFIMFKTSFRWAPKSEIGPFVAQNTLGIATQNPETYTSTFPETKVRLTTLNAGLCFGLKIGKNQ